MSAAPTRIRSTVCVTSLLVVVFAVQSTSAAEIAYRFNGTVISSTGTPWGQAISNFTPVVGVFSYDSESQPTHQIGSCDCLGYRQQRLNGFFAKFGSTYIRADDYVVEVLNDFPQNENETADIFAINWANTYSPPIESPIYVGPTPYATGLFSVSLVADTSLYDSSSLPEQIEASSFHTRLGLLSDTGEELIDVVFSITSLTRLDLLDGDYDVDNDVDLADFTKWRVTFGSVGDLMADGNQDGIVNAADYTIWRDTFQSGMSALAEAALTVPEPGIGPIIALHCIACCALRQRHHKSTSIHFA